MVAAWISAETGVGPSIASGSHVWSGTCADFAAAPMNRVAQIQKISDELKPPAAENVSPKPIECTLATIRKIANIMPTSPRTLITKALRAAATAERRSNQKPIKKYDATPTRPQPTSNPTQLSESTSVSIANTKKLMYAKKRA